MESRQFLEEWQVSLRIVKRITQPPVNVLRFASLQRQNQLQPSVHGVCQRCGQASCAVGTVEFEWKKKQADDSFLTVLSAPNAAAYVKASATEEDSGIYRCDVSDAMYTVSSAEISLNVGTGVPAAGLVGLALAAAFTALAGAVAIRKERR